jgi:hypothetical protein
MDTKKLSILILCLISFISFTRQEVCPTFTCGTLPTGDCSQRKIDNSTHLTSYTLEDCKDTNLQCPFYELEDQDKDTLKCEQKSSVNTKFYPGGPCETNDDCHNGSCVDGVCSGIAENEKCKKNSECFYGFACRKNGKPDDQNTYCLPQKTEGEICESDLECVNSHGCYKGKCIPYFSLPDGSPIEVNPPEHLSFCQSGNEFDKACARFTLNGGNQEECTEAKPCTYTNYDGKTVSIQENCVCGYNPFGKKYCKLGSGDKEFIKFIQDSKNLLTDATNCNTLERKGICNHNKKLPNKHVIQLNGNYTNSHVLAEHAQELVGADKCVINVAYPEFIPDTPEPPVPPEPENKTCARYTCKRNQKLCAHSHYDLTTNLTNVLLSDICDSKSTCNIGGDPNVVFYKKEDVDGKCTLKDPATHLLRYPGEDCKVDTDCWSPDKSLYPDEKLVGTCKNGKCQGYGKNDACKQTAWCNVGYYCGVEEKCVAQKKENTACGKTLECQNHLVCFEGKCQNKLFSQPAGTDVTGKTDIDYELVCSFGKAFGGICDFFNNTDTVDPKTELVKCNPDDDCNYMTAKGPIKHKCECGFNGNGLSYCPKGNNHGNI